MEAELRIHAETEEEAINKAFDYPMHGVKGKYRDDSFDVESDGVYSLEKKDEAGG